MKHWYNIDISADSFSGEVEELCSICQKRDKALILRDWSYVNFSPNKYNAMSPANDLLILNSINIDSVKPFAFVRNAVDVWLSRGKVPLKSFSKEYLNYAKEVVNRGIPIIKYEDFCQDPENTIKEICHHTGLEYNDSWQNFNDFSKCNGDNQRGKKSRHYTKQEIKLLKRKKINLLKKIKLSCCKEIKEANALLGYEE